MVPRTTSTPDMLLLLLLSVWGSGTASLLWSWVSFPQEDMQTECVEEDKMSKAVR